MVRGSLNCFPSSCSLRRLSSMVWTQGEVGGGREERIGVGGRGEGGSGESATPLSTSDLGCPAEQSHGHSKAPLQ